MDPQLIPPVAGAVPARAILIVRGCGCRIGETTVRPPALFWRAADREVWIRRTPGSTEAAPDGGASGARLRDGTFVAGDRRRTSGEVPAIWLLIIGQRLLDQLIVGAFGEPGFSRFLEGFAGAGSSPTGGFLDDLVPLLEAVARELDQRPAAYRVRVRSVLTDVFLSLYRATLAAEAESPASGFRLAVVIDHIELNYDDHLDLESLARIMQTSPTHLSRVFRREVGIPLFEYVNRTRIRKACTLLRRTELPITRIAVDVGYNNVSFFNRYFRRIMRCSPREYRRDATD